MRNYPYDFILMRFDDSVMVARRANCTGDGVATGTLLRGSRVANALVAGGP